MKQGPFPQAFPECSPVSRKSQFLQLNTLGTPVRLKGEVSSVHETKRTVQGPTAHVFTVFQDAQLRGSR